MSEIKPALSAEEWAHGFSPKYCAHAKPLADAVSEILATVPGSAAVPLHVSGNPGVVVMPYRMEQPLDVIDALKRAVDLAGMVGWEIVLTTDGLMLRRAE